MKKLLILPGDGIGPEVTKQCIKIIDFFKESENFSFDEAREEFEEDEFSDDEIRLLRIEFISSVGN